MVFAVFSVIKWILNFSKSSKKKKTFTGKQNLIDASALTLALDSNYQKSI